MRTSQILFLLAVYSTSPAFSETASRDDIAALKVLVEQQNRLLSEQSDLLRSLGRRVTVLEGRRRPTEGKPASIEDSDLIPAHEDQQAEVLATVNLRTDSDEISLEQKDKLRTGKETQIVDDAIVLSENVDLYGSFRIFSEAGDQEPTLNDGSSRLGIRFERQPNRGPALFGRVEWKVNLVDNDSQLFASDADGGSGIVIREEQSGDALTTRLGYLGARIDDIGELSFGKQWSVYYDVAGWTDNFNVYGGSGLSVYSAGTDGGALGSGRADNAVVFRNDRGSFSYGLQTQLQTKVGNDEYTGLGASLITSPSPDWDVGFAFSGAKVEGDFERITDGNESAVAALGARYHRGPWYAALGVAAWKNHEAIYFEDDTLIYDGVGVEIFTSYEYSPRLHLYGGFNYTNPDIDDPRVDPDFGLEFLILGASFFTTPESLGYIELLLSNATDTAGETVESVISLGYRYDY